MSRTILVPTFDYRARLAYTLTTFMAVAAEARVFFKQNKPDRSLTIGVRDGEHVIKSSLRTVSSRIRVLGHDVAGNPLFRRSARIAHRQAKVLAEDINTNG